MGNKQKLKFKDVIGGNKPVLVDFYATWCGPCKALSPIVDEVKKELGTSMKVIKIDVDKKKSISDKYKVRSLPTLAIFQNGKILWQESGMKSKGELLRIANKYIKSSPQPISTAGTNASEEQKKSWFGRLLGK